MKSPLLLLGLFFSTLLAWGMLRLCNKQWKDAGLYKPKSIGRLLFVTLLATVILFPLSSVKKQVVINLTGAMPDLENFSAIHGNFLALAVGLLSPGFSERFSKNFFFADTFKIHFIHFV